MQSEDLCISQKMNGLAIKTKVIQAGKTFYVIKYFSRTINSENV